MNTTQILKTGLIKSALATVAAAAVPALLFGASGTAQAAPAAPVPMTTIHSLPQFRPGDLPLPLDDLDTQLAAAEKALLQAEADYKSKNEAADYWQNALQNATNNYAEAVRDRDAKQAAVDNAKRALDYALRSIPANIVSAQANLKQKQADLDDANSRVSTLQQSVNFALKARNDSEAAAAQAKKVRDDAAAKYEDLHVKKYGG